MHTTRRKPCVHLQTLFLVFCHVVHVIMRIELLFIEFSAFLPLTEEIDNVNKTSKNECMTEVGSGSFCGCCAGHGGTLGDLRTPDQIYTQCNAERNYDFFEQIV